MAQRKRIEKGMQRRAEQMNLAVSEVRLERGRLLIQAIMPSHLRLANVERGLQGGLRGLMQKEFPHLMRGKTTRGGDMEGIPF